jgi:hypothetical protein
MSCPNSFLILRRCVMKRLVSVCVVLWLAMMVSTIALAGNGEKPEKIIIAHLAAVEVDEVTGDTTYYYNVLEVSERSWPDHEAHGDVLPGGTLPDETIWGGGSKGDKFTVVVLAPE